MNFFYPAALAGLIAVYFVFRARQAALDLGSKGLPVRPVIPAGALFGEARASGYFVRGALSGFAGANNCLLVWVTRDEFVVDVIFPLNLLMHEMESVPRVRVPVARITSARQVNERSAVVAFSAGDGKPRSVRLSLKNPGHLISALKSLNVRIGQPGD